MFETIIKSYPLFVETGILDEADSIEEGASLKEIETEEEYLEKDFPESIKNIFLFQRELNLKVLK